MVISELRGSVRPYTLYSVVDWNRRKRRAIGGRRKRMAISELLSVLDAQFQTELSGINKEPLFLPDNSKSLRKRVVTISSNEKVSKYALKTFTYFSKVFLKCLNLDSFNLKFSSFITYVTSNIKSIFSAFLNRFSNFNFDINKIRLYKSDSVK